MPKFIVQHRTHSKWYTFEVEANTFGEAAVQAVVDNCKSLGLDLDKIPHEVSFNAQDDGYCSVVFREKARRAVFGRTTTPGELWFGDRVREGHPDDCENCAGTGVGFHNPFRQCWACGDAKQPGKGTGKKPVTELQPA
jgi:hypothetical protein